MARFSSHQIKFSRCEELVFNWKRGNGHQIDFWKNRLFYWNLFPTFKILPSFPDHVDVEVSTACNMKCPMCYTLAEPFRGNVKKEFMEYSLFTKIVDECSRHKIFSIRLSLRGESFIHPDIVKMARYAKGSNIKEVSSLTNMLAVTQEMFEELVKMQFDWLTISFDGLGEEYEKIRKPAKFDEAYEKIKIFKSIKDRYGSVKPVIKVQTIWTAIEKHPEEFYRAFAPYVDMVASNPLSENFDTTEYEYMDTFICPVLYQRIVVTPSGEVILCPNDDYSKVIVGSVKDTSLYDIWHGKKMAEIRNLHKIYGGYKKAGCCRECYMARKTEEVLVNINGKQIKMFRFAERRNSR